MLTCLPFDRRDTVRFHRTHDYDGCADLPEYRRQVFRRRRRPGHGAGGTDEQHKACDEGMRRRTLRNFTCTCGCWGTSILS